MNVGTLCPWISLILHQQRLHQQREESCQDSVTLINERAAAIKCQHVCQPMNGTKHFILFMLGSINNVWHLLISSSHNTRPVY